MAKYLACLVLCAGAVAASAQAPQSTLPLDPARERNTSITPAYEGWYKNPDGSFSFLIGYYNRNSKQALDIPVGPDNKFEPGEPDQGQPTHFEIGRQWGVFVVKVPADFGDKVLTWRITANGETQSIPFTLNPGYPITPFEELGMGNKPPVLKFAEDGKTVTGPPVEVAASYTGAVGQPVAIKVWVNDPKETAPGSTQGRPGANVATLSFHKFRGPGGVKFDPARASVKEQGAMASTTATFNAAGEYLLRVQANDESGEGGGGFQCCWSNAYVKVTIK